MTEEVTRIINSNSKRFPDTTWGRIKKLQEQLNNNEITEGFFERRILSIADYYDNIKTSERWWGQDMGFSIPVGEEANYGSKKNNKTPTKKEV